MGFLVKFQYFKKTGYSEQNLYINQLNKGEKILLIDDVVSTGGTYIAVIKALKKIGVEIKDAIAVIEKGKGKKIVKDKTGCSLTTIIKMDVINNEVVIESTIID